MTFDDVWREVKGLPDMAMVHVPEMLSEKTKKALAEMPPEEVAWIVSEIIEDVNRGSIHPLDMVVIKDWRDDEKTGSTYGGSGFANASHFSVHIPLH